MDVLDVGVNAVNYFTLGSLGIGAVYNGMQNAYVSSGGKFGKAISGGISGGFTAIESYVRGAGELLREGRLSQSALSGMLGLNDRQLNKLRERAGGNAFLAPSKDKIDWDKRVGLNNLNRYAKDIAQRYTRYGKDLISGRAFLPLADAAGVGDQLRMKVDSNYRMANWMSGGNRKLRRYFAANKGIMDLVGTITTGPMYSYRMGMYNGGGKGGRYALLNDIGTAMKVAPM